MEPRGALVTTALQPHAGRIRMFLTMNRNLVPLSQSNPFSLVLSPILEQNISSRRHLDTKLAREPQRESRPAYEV